MGLFDSIVNGITGGLNYSNEKNNLEWQKEAQRTTWEREDNAVQRRAADMQKAGLSKTLAAGGAAQASAPISTTAPHLELHPSLDQSISQSAQVAQTAMNMIKQQADITQTQAQTNLMRNQLGIGKISLANKADERSLYKQFKVAGYKGHIPTGSDVGGAFQLAKNASVVGHITSALLSKAAGNLGHSRKYKKTGNVLQDDFNNLGG